MRCSFQGWFSEYTTQTRTVKNINVDRYKSNHSPNHRPKKGGKHRTVDDRAGLKTHNNSICCVQQGSLVIILSVICSHPPIYNSGNEVGRASMRGKLTNKQSLEVSLNNMVFSCFVISGIENMARLQPRQLCSPRIPGPHQIAGVVREIQSWMLVQPCK